MFMFVFVCLSVFACSFATVAYHSTLFHYVCSFDFLPGIGRCGVAREISYIIYIFIASQIDSSS